MFNLLATLVAPHMQIASPSNTKILHGCNSKLASVKKNVFPPFYSLVEMNNVATISVVHVVRGQDESTT